MVYNAVCLIIETDKIVGNHNVVIFIISVERQNGSLFYLMMNDVIFRLEIN